MAKKSAAVFPETFGSLIKGFKAKAKDFTYPKLAARCRAIGIELRTLTLENKVGAVPAQTESALDKAHGEKPFFVNLIHNVQKAKPEKIEKEAFDDKYRGLWQYQDEAFSTSAVREIFLELVQGDVAATKKFTPAQISGLAAIFNEISRVRLPTGYVGWGIHIEALLVVFQHPTGAPKYAHTKGPDKKGPTENQVGMLHNLFDRMRQGFVVLAIEAALKKPTRTVGDVLLRGGLLAAISFTANAMAAAPTASNMVLLAPGPESDEDKKFKAVREAFKDRAIGLGGSRYAGDKLNEARDWEGLTRLLGLHELVVKEGAAHPFLRQVSEERVVGGKSKAPLAKGGKVKKAKTAKAPPMKDLLVGKKKKAPEPKGGSKAKKLKKAPAAKEAPKGWLGESKAAAASKYWSAGKKAKKAPTVKLPKVSASKMSGSFEYA